MGTSSIRRVLRLVGHGKHMPSHQRLGVSSRSIDTQSHNEPVAVGHQVRQQLESVSLPIHHMDEFFWLFDALRAGLDLLNPTRRFLVRFLGIVGPRLFFAVGVAVGLGRISSGPRKQGQHAQRPARSCVQR
jgi:hypothetical protein